MNRTTRVAGSVAAAALVTAGLSALVPASAKGGDAIVAKAACSKTSVTKIAAKARDGRIEIELEVDSNRNGQVWSYAISHDTTIVKSGSATTVAPSGSFTVRTSTVDAAGVHRISGTARNASTGETCSVAVSI